MTCAGCDDCPTNSWHLHVTVLPHKSWGPMDMANAIQTDLRRQAGLKIVRVTNMFRDPNRRSYVEIIPTMHVSDADEASATWQLHLLAHRLNNNGWRVRRMKLEADARLVPVGRALYYESHVKHPAIVHMSPMSVNSGGQKILTIRRKSVADIDKVFDHWRDVLFIDEDIKQPRIEACTLDTNPSLDHEWITQ